MTLAIVLVITAALALVFMLRDLSERFGVRIPFLVMTSHATHAETEAFFQQHKPRQMDERPFVQDIINPKDEPQSSAHE